MILKIVIEGYIVVGKTTGLGNILAVTYEKL